MDVVKNLNHKFMQQNLSKVTDRTLPFSVGVSAHVKLNYQFHAMFLQTFEVISYLKVTFLNVHLRFLDTIDHLKNDPAPTDHTETTTPRAPDSRKEVFFLD